MSIKKRLALAAVTTLLPNLEVGVMPNPVVAAQVAQNLSVARYPYQSAAWNSLLRDSYKQFPEKIFPFEQWLEAAYRGTTRAHLGSFTNLADALQSRRRELAAAKGQARVSLERKTGVWLHKMVKAMIPKFSLERGFEFVYTIKNGERQCLLQSVLIAALAQKMGIDAGIAMVWKNDLGRVSNLGHVTAVFRLENGLDVLIDASDPEPFFMHQGVLMFDTQANDWRFLEPNYDASGNIVSYKRSKDGTAILPRQIIPLDFAYIRSQFEFYRGERTPGGFIGPSNPLGLAGSAKHLELAVQYEPGNALALYVLSLVERKQNKPYKPNLERAAAMYERYGFVPDGVKAAMAQ